MLIAMRVYNIAQLTPLFKNKFRHRIAVHEAAAAIDLGAENMEQVAQTASKAPLNIGERDVVATSATRSATRSLDISMLGKAR